MGICRYLLDVRAVHRCRLAGVDTHCAQRKSRDKPGFFS
jgi:hypothetical protein